ncbi:MAG: tRNA (guanosine(37)-N1)-methyltransferase TrmD [Puniceicoccaceae bacterium]|nr:MAG: tRNA (guanosine(37)-N1)-methyltransferase TrmD [Puniceicoccaceae bacterium]
MKIDVLTLFPEILEAVLDASIIGRARRAGLLELKGHNLREWATDRHRTVDDRPFGGGAGMLLKPEPLCDAIDALAGPQTCRIYLTPDGQPLRPALAEDLSRLPHLLLVSGHYEGIDQRVRDTRIDREISIGDYVLTNGTLAAAVLVDVVARFLPGVLGDENSLTAESFTGSLLDFPHYTRPAVFRGLQVPEVLLSGDHEAIARWRQEMREEKTRRLRPDLTTHTHESDC